MSVPRGEATLPTSPAMTEVTEKDHHDPAAYIFCPGICFCVIALRCFVFF